MYNPNTVQPRLFATRLSAIPCLSPDNYKLPIFLLYKPPINRQPPPIAIRQATDRYRSANSPVKPPVITIIVQLTRANESYTICTLPCS